MLNEQALTAQMAGSWKDEFWTIIFVIISIDLIYEYFVGVNTLGFKSYMPGRLSGFFGDELVAGYFYFGFI